MSTPAFQTSHVTVYHALWQLAYDRARGVLGEGTIRGLVGEWHE